MAAFTTTLDLTETAPGTWEFVPDGIHFDLPAPLYFGQDALGSTDLIRLHKRGLGWWWTSRHNPDHKQAQSKEQFFGQLLHALLLEGRKAFDERYAVEPERPANDPATIKAMRAALERGGYHVRTAPGAGLAVDWQNACRAAGIPVWANTIADFERRIGERARVTAADAKMLDLMADVALSDQRADNEAVRHLFAEGSDKPALAEVSVLKTYPDGTRRRWRFDRMFPGFDLDLKTLGNWSGRPLPWAVGDAIARSGYDIQRADYFEGRWVAMDFIREGGHVHGGTREQRQWLGMFPEIARTWDWVWLFYQKPDAAAGRAPVVFPVRDVSYAREHLAVDCGSFEDAVSGETAALAGLSDTIRHGHTKKLRALDLYRRCVAEYGLYRPWAMVEPVHYVQEGYGPTISLPPWIAEEEPTEESAWAGDA